MGWPGAGDAGRGRRCGRGSRAQQRALPEQELRVALATVGAAGAGAAGLGAGVATGAAVGAGALGAAAGLGAGATPAGAVATGACGATGGAAGFAATGACGAAAGAGGCGGLAAGFGGSGTAASGFASTSGLPCNVRRTFSATSTGIELECVFFSVTPNPGSRSIIAFALTSSSRANSLIRTWDASLILR